MDITNITPGMMAEQTTNVIEDFTARAIGSGSLAVYGTPAMIALMEAAAAAAIDPFLPSGFTSVGIHIDVQHIAATPVGEQVRARAEVTHVEGKRVEFVVQAWDDEELIGDGIHTRYVINTQNFMDRVNQQNTDNADQDEQI